jgi:hypothetical protein
MKIAKESWIIAAIGVADLVTTIVFIRHHGAQEANPLFRHYWEMGVWAFIVAKMVCLLGPLMVLEWARRRNPRFVAGALRTAIVGYLGFYFVGYMQLNGPKAAAAEVTLRSRPIFVMSRQREEQESMLRLARYLQPGDCGDAPCTALSLQQEKTFRPFFHRSHHRSLNMSINGFLHPSYYQSLHQGMWKFEAPSFALAAAHTTFYDRRSGLRHKMDD